MYHLSIAETLQSQLTTNAVENQKTNGDTSNDKVLCDTSQELKSRPKTPREEVHTLEKLCFHHCARSSTQLCLDLAKFIKSFGKTMPIEGAESIPFGRGTSLDITVAERLDQESDRAEEVSLMVPANLHREKVRDDMQGGSCSLTTVNDIHNAFPNLRIFALFALLRASDVLIKAKRSEFHPENIYSLILKDQPEMLSKFERTRRGTWNFCTDRISLYVLQSLDCCKTAPSNLQIFGVCLTMSMCKKPQFLGYLKFAGKDMIILHS
jgi:hypothetical protein